MSGANSDPTPRPLPRQRPLRVLVATSVHTPLDARIHHRQIRALRAAGVAVTYAAPWADTATHTAQAAAGVVPVDLPRAQGRDRARALRTARRALRALGPQHDLILLHDPELVLAVRGQLDRLPPVVLDVHEDLRASIVDRPWVPRPLAPIARRTAEALEHAAERDLAGLLLAERGYAARFAGDHPVVENLPWLPATPPPAASEHRVVYVGRLSLGRGVLELLSMARELARDPWNPRVELVGPADGNVAGVLERAHGRGIVIWHGFLPNEQAMSVVAGSVAGLAPLRDLDNYRGSLPTKVAEYLAHGVPAIVTPLPEAARLVRESGAGEVVDFQDVGGLTAAVRRLALDPGRTVELGDGGRAYARQHLSWDGAASAFVAHLHRLAGLPAPHRMPSSPEPPARSANGERYSTTGSGAPRAPGLALATAGRAGEGGSPQPQRSPLLFGHPRHHTARVR